jgi:hypothetical protein
MVRATQDDPSDPLPHSLVDHPAKEEEQHAQHVDGHFGPFCQ